MTLGDELHMLLVKLGGSGAGLRWIAPLSVLGHEVESAAVSIAIEAHGIQMMREELAAAEERLARRRAAHARDEHALREAMAAAQHASVGIALTARNETFNATKENDHHASPN